MYRLLTILVIVVAVLLRVLLCWENPPSNAFDNHYEPIALILQTGQIPDKNACFQCYNPPVFYYLSALFAKAVVTMGVKPDALQKALQLLNCVYGILTLLVLYAILVKLKFTGTSRLTAFSMICFLPRDIFMSAIHSNDSLTYLAISLCAYLLLVAIDRELSLPVVGLLGIAVTATIFVKYTAYLVLPMVAVPLLTVIAGKPAIPRPRSVAALVIVLIMPLVFLGSYFVGNFEEYGRILPWNDSMINTSQVHPRDPEGVSFTSFTPVQYIREPIIMPGQVHSFWTLIYSGMWADTEPKFVFYTDGNDEWWRQFTSWENGSSGFPSAPIPISRVTRLITSGLLVCGLIPLCLVITGGVRCLIAIMNDSKAGSNLESAKFQIFPLILLFNTFGIILLVLKAPVYSSMKASYFLNSLPAFIVFIALGIQYIEKTPWMKTLVVSTCCIIAALSSLYTVRIASALSLVQG